MNKKITSNEDQIAEVERLRKRVHELEDLLDRNDYVEKELSIVYDALASSINAIIITDVRGKIEYVNKAFLNMFEYRDKSDVIGKLAADIFVTKNISKFSDIENIIDETEGNTSEFQVFRKDGSIFPVEVSTSIVTDTEERVVGKMASLIDVTDRKLVEEENRRLSSKLLESQELERQRVAKDLHDGIGQTILAAKLNFIAYKRSPEKFKDRLDIGLQFIDNISQEIREVCNDLYPSILSDYGLESAINWYSRDHLQLNNIKTDVTISLKGKIRHKLEVNLYRIVKEIFSNIIKHSQAERVVLELYNDAEYIYLRVQDNGIGFSPKRVKAAQQGFGLSSIKHRVKELGGEIDIETEEGAGTAISIKINNGT